MNYTLKQFVFLLHPQALWSGSLTTVYWAIWLLFLETRTKGVKRLLLKLRCAPVWTVRLLPGRISWTVMVQQLIFFRRWFTSVAAVFIFIRILILNLLKAILISLLIAGTEPKLSKCFWKLSVNRASLLNKKYLLLNVGSL